MRADRLLCTALKRIIYLMLIKITILPEKEHTNPGQNYFLICSPVHSAFTVLSYVHMENACTGIKKIICDSKLPRSTIFLQLTGRW